jgi:hypothetical protein
VLGETLYTSNLALPREDLSAREAAEVILLEAKNYLVKEQTTSIASNGRIAADGRLEVGNWHFQFLVAKGDQQLTVSLSVTGKLTVSLWNLPRSAVTFSICDDWLDSVDAAQLIRNEPSLAGQGVALTMMSCELCATEELGLVWHIRRRYWGSTTMTEAKQSFLISALDGSLISESLERRRLGIQTESKYRDRRCGGSWITLL